VAAALFPVAEAQGQGAGVTISGGADESGHHYAWTITSTFPSPIVYVEFPEYRSDLFRPPPGWSERPAQAGFRAAGADGAASAVPPGRTAAFTLRIRPAGAQRGRGSVRIRFADGAETIVTGVEVPTVPSDRNIGLIGLAVLFAGWVVVRAVRKRHMHPS